VHHTHDSSLWPPQGVIYEEATIRAQGPQRAKERFCLRWTENAEHISPSFLPTSSKRATSTWLIDYMPIIEQSLLDLCDWAEKGVVPAGTTYTFSDGKVSLPATANERGGIQPVVSVTVNGSQRADVKVNASVSLELNAAVPLAGGTIIAVEWSLDGSGEFTAEPGINGQARSLKLSKTHRYAGSGVYFATARVTSHRDGDVSAESRRLVNVASARIVVT
jgi:hypothetical protein